MWPLWLVIVVTVAGAVIFTITGILLAVSLERRRHHALLRNHGDLITYHRPNLSANENNYSHVTLPGRKLRRSIQMPYGIVSIGSSDYISTRDEEQDVQTDPQPFHDSEEVLRPQRTRDIKRSFPGHALHIPKSRRQKKIQKVMPLEKAQKSPPSAITEFTDPECPSPAVADVPGSSSTSNPFDKAVKSVERQFSMQWPLMSSKTRLDAAPTEVLSMAARSSMLMRMVGVNPVSNARPAPLARTVSASSTASSAPEEPLPPLPTTDVYKHTRMQNSRPRASHASLDTIGSSVLRISMNPTNDAAESTVTDGEGGLSAFEADLRRKATAPRLQLEPGRRAMGGLHTTKPSLRSVHPSLDMNKSTMERSHEKPGLQSVPTIIVREDSFKTIDASQWASPLRLDVGKTRAGSANRHSMIEPFRLSQWRTASDPLRTNTGIEDANVVGLDLQRPASVATANPLQWDLQGEFSKIRRSISPLNGPRRGHKRQNCVRITNLPALTPVPKRFGQLPELQEEHQPMLLGDKVRQQSKTEQTGSRVHPFKIEVDSSPTPIPSPSPFTNCPILTPTPTIRRPPRKQYIQPPRSIAPDRPRPDSDVFNSNTGLLTAYASTPRPWGLSPRLDRHMPFTSTPPSVDRNDQQPFESSPILPSPALKVSALYPRKSLVQGPRNPNLRTASQKVRGTTCSSPLQNKQGSSMSFHISKDRVAAAAEPGELDLRKSVMLMRSLYSDNRLANYSSSKTHIPHMVVGALEGEEEEEEEEDNGLETPSYASTPMTTSPVMLDRDPGTTMLHPTRPSKLVVAPPPTLSVYPPHNPRQQQLSASPSAVSSTGAGSVWEDDSVRGESPTPEPQFPPSLALRPRPNPHSNSSSVLDSRAQQRAHTHAHTHYAAQSGTSVMDLDLDFEAPDRHSHSHLLWKGTSSKVRAHRAENSSPGRRRLRRLSQDIELAQRGYHSSSHNVFEPENAQNAHLVSALVQNLERVVNGGQWDADAGSGQGHGHGHGHGHNHDHDRVVLQGRRSRNLICGKVLPERYDGSGFGGVGLGLRLGGDSTPPSY
ncbi:hypothetical protein LTR20_005899 [Exophiala xenobiotica]|nr:hypothetical protein LTS13_003132 [Exophiala xenobiotica]KAK5396124.1 hypothetical protein LTR79_006878 [Exophiala xenobiotica]KAK5424078.1 hypothetical protein LTR90_001424 [Exophiala xenobiotica]KAK5461950.1 hypothetical protein LTR20_005899 [Exophiala xenobiotica]KAK5479881.1 hypothetical protein LTR26_007734 [Exophiala xenobiotica]